MIISLPSFLAKIDGTAEKVIGTAVCFTGYSGRSSFQKSLHSLYIHKMQALRLAHSSALRPALAAQRRCIATATANHVDIPASASSTPVAPVSLSNVEAHWGRLSSDEKVALHEQLELLQRKDWKELSLNEKKAGAYTF
jgi:hypothetical protein